MLAVAFYQQESKKKRKKNLKFGVTPTCSTFSIEENKQENYFLEEE